MCDAELRHSAEVWCCILLIHSVHDGEPPLLWTGKALRPNGSPLVTDQTCLHCSNAKRLFTFELSDANTGTSQHENTTFYFGFASIDREEPESGRCYDGFRRTTSQCETIWFFETRSITNYTMFVILLRVAKICGHSPRFFFSFFREKIFTAFSFYRLVCKTSWNCVGVSDIVAQMFRKLKKKRFSNK